MSVKCSLDVPCLLTGAPGPDYAPDAGAARQPDSPVGLAAASGGRVCEADAALPRDL
jgi:hypothetical protein